MQGMPSARATVRMQGMTSASPVVSLFPPASPPPTRGDVGEHNGGKIILMASMVLMVIGTVLVSPDPGHCSHGMSIWYVHAHYGPVVEGVVPRVGHDVGES